MNKLKNLTLTLAFFGLAFSASAQLNFGVGTSFWLEGSTEVGIQAKVLNPVTDVIDVAGSFTYYLGDPLSFSLDFDAHYNLLTFGEEIKLAPMAGINYTKISAPGISVSNTALQIGAFLKIPTDKFLFYLEPKLIIDDGSGFVIAAGIML